jgi:hypothetical protein
MSLPRPFPIGKPNHGAANTHITSSLSVALRAARALADAGHTLLRVEVGDRNPRIEIAPGRLTQALNGVEYITRHGPGRAEHHYAARVDGAQVTWVETR